MCRCPCLLYASSALTHFQSRMRVTSLEMKAVKTHFVSPLVSYLPLCRGHALNPAAVYEPGKQVSAVFEGLRGAENVSGLQLRAISAVNHQIMEGEACKPGAGGVGAAGEEASGRRPLEKLTSPL